MALRTAAVSRIGGRERNEDALRWGEEGDAGDTGGWWVVADGLGGHACGEIAAELAVEAAAGVLGALADPAAGAVDPQPLPQQLAAAIEAAHRAILEGIAADPQARSGMGATIVAAACDATHLSWAHCGDSRLYRFVGGTLHGFTRDHSVAAMIEPPRRDERPNAARNQLLRVLGVSDDPIEFDVHPPVALEPNERWLLCTDGWWELVLETEMEQDLAASSSPAEWLQRMEQRIERRLDADSDNYTAIAVWSD